MLIAQERAQIEWTETWESDATDYFDHQPAFHTIEWVDPSFHARWIVPLEGNEAALDQTTWRVRVWPRTELLAGLRTALPGVALGVGLLMALLVALAVRFAHMARRRARELERASHQLESEVAERKQAEERFRSIVEFAPDAIVIVDEEGRVVLANRQTETLFGYTRKELLGQAVEILLPERFRHGHLQHRTAYFSRPCLRGMGVGLELYGLRKDESEFPVEISLSPLPEEEGLLVSSSIRDITERKRTEARMARYAEELEHSNADLQQFAYVASHDLREPLRMVASYTKLLAERYRGKLDSDADKFIAYAVDGATHMQQLIDDLLAYSRVQSRGKEFEPVDLEVVLDQALTNLEITIKENDVAVTRDPLPTVMADATQMVQLFQNLIGNAIKFSSGDGTQPEVHVRAERRDGEHLLAVADNGIGVEPEYADRIFAIFQRLHGRGEYTGTGIGLSICKRIVERHGGRIWVESVPGKGSTFYFTIPGK
ncbi:MAG: ATP-binding protein [Gemmatimonadota bacterium]